MILSDEVLTEESRLHLVNSLSYKTMTDYNWWDGWWRVGPRNSVEHVLYLLWKPYIDPNDYPKGIEYWSRKLTAPDPGLAWHQDTNEKEFSTDEYQIAGASMTYYTSVDNLTGGNLEMYPYDSREKGNTRLSIHNYLESGKGDEYKETIRCVQNRMVLYDSARLHRVSVVHKGVRENLASSIWFEKPMIFHKHENYDRNWKPQTWEAKHETNRY
tara:strand:+ start:1089 stop:1730 length:642 start_codon:yes stop_codon:yes gene_type:complete